MKKHRAAVIGCGKIGSEYADELKFKSVYAHAHAYATCPSTEIVALCDADPAKLERAGERWKVATRYSDLIELLGEQGPEIVSVCTPDETHYDLIRATLAAPGTRAVLAEKPLALTLAHAKELVATAAERGIALAVNYSRRYAKNHRELREWLRGGGIGTIRNVSGSYTKGTLHNGTHWFDLARFLIGEVTRVWGFDTLHERKEDPTLDAVLEFAGSATAHLLGCDEAAFTVFEMDLIGTRGRVRIVDVGHVIEIYDVHPSQNYADYCEPLLRERRAGGMEDTTLHAVENLVECLENNAQPLCSGNDAVAALAIALAVRDSAASGRAVDLR
jgi:predicted dehydrogenase